MNIINICLWLYIFCKPFYLSKSGSLQISDLFVILAFIFTCLGKRRKKMIDKNVMYIVIFVSLISIINFIYYICYQSQDFIVSSMYYIFILVGIMLLNTKIKDKQFLNVAYYIFMLDIVIQLFLYIIGIGKNWGNTNRYMGTLRDPNQLAFFIFLCMMYIHILEKILKKKKRIIIYLIGIYIIFLSASTGMLLAIASFVSLSIISNVEYMIKIRRILTSKKIIITALIILLSLLFLGLNQKNWNNTVNFIDKNLVKSSIIERAKAKLNNSNDDFIKDRNLEILVNNCEYIFYGSGEGNLDRFDANGEIHSTIPSILFYYGCIPTIILFLWIYKYLKGLKFRDLVPYIAIFIESFTLLNQRQLLLWGIIMLAQNLKNNNLEESKKDIERGYVNEENFDNNSCI